MTFVLQNLTSVLLLQKFQYTSTIIGKTSTPVNITVFSPPSLNTTLIEILQFLHGEVNEHRYFVRYSFDLIESTDH